MRISVLCTVIALVLAAAPASAARESWGFHQSGEEAILVHGVPESEQITITFICESKKKNIQIGSTVMPRRTGPKRAGKIKLSNGSSSLEYPGKTSQGINDTGIVF